MVRALALRLVAVAHPAAAQTEYYHTDAGRPVRMFPFRSILVGADVVAERLVGLSTRTDVTAEAGVRLQATPWIVLDAGLGWRFAGVKRAMSGTFGATYAFGLRGATRGG